MAKLTTKDGEGEPVTFGNNKPTNLTPLGKKTAEFIKTELCQLFSKSGTRQRSY